MSQEQRRQGDTAGTLAQITVREAWTRLNDAGAQPKPLLVDVREEWEYTAGHAAGAVNVPLSEFRERFRDIPSDGDILLICHVGERSLVAARFLCLQGFGHVANVDGGTEEWEAAHLPLEQRPRTD